jgi:glycosyltransferase involved in cell wall biosynthesis
LIRKGLPAGERLRSPEYGGGCRPSWYLSLPVKNRASPPVVALVVPCHNETDRFDGDRYVEYVARHPHLHITFVDDGSMDGTDRMLEELVKRDPAQLRWFRIAPNLGKAEAVRRGMLRVLEDEPRFAGYWDADLASPLEEIEHLRRCLERHGDLLISMGARVRMMGRRIQRPAWRHFVGRVYAVYVRELLDLQAYDTQCGAKLFRVTPGTSTLFQEKFTGRWVFDVEILLRLRDQLGGRGLRERVREVPLESWEDVGESQLHLHDYLLTARDVWRLHLRHPRAKAL